MMPLFGSELQNGKLGDTTIPNPKIIGQMLRPGRKSKGPGETIDAQV